jgi:predicted small lipoprotein YifL
VLGFASPFRINALAVAPAFWLLPQRPRNGHVTMLRQINRGGALTIALALALVCGVTACGIKGPLRPAPKTQATPPSPPPIDNPATPPATTSPALPPPSSSSERRP